jgi:hypothetical protein
MNQSVENRNTTTSDGMPCIRRASRLWMTDVTAARYMGMTVGAFRNWAYAHKLKRIRHGKVCLTSKDEIDKASGASTGE